MRELEGLSGAELARAEREQLALAAGSAVVRIAGKIRGCFELSPTLSALKSSHEAPTSDQVAQVLSELGTEQIGARRGSMRGQGA